jgi:hypothetical protein
MKVILQYHDTSSFLPEEIIRQAEENYGNRVNITLLPDSDAPIDHLYFAVQRMITGDFLTVYYDSGALYEKDMKKLRAEFLYKVGEVFDDVVHEVTKNLNQE